MPVNGGSPMRIKKELARFVEREPACRVATVGSWGFEEDT